MARMPNRLSEVHDSLVGTAVLVNKEVVYLMKDASFQNYYSYGHGREFDMSGYDNAQAGKIALSRVWSMGNAVFHALNRAIVAGGGEPVEHPNGPLAHRPGRHGY